MSCCDLLAFCVVLRINHKGVYVVSNTYLKCSLNIEMRWWNGAESIKISYSSWCLAALCLNTEIRESWSPGFTKERDTSTVTVKTFSLQSPACVKYSVHCSVTPKLFLCRIVSPSRSICIKPCQFCLVQYTEVWGLIKCS